MTGFRWTRWSLPRRVRLLERGDRGQRRNRSAHRDDYPRVNTSAQGTFMQVKVVPAK